jgi:hypothetical protein
VLAIQSRDAMTKKISAGDAETLSETPISEEDATFLKRFYAQQRFLAGESVIDKVKIPSLSDAQIIEHQREFVSTVHPELVDAIDDAKAIANYREHESSSSEILGDYPRKIKKWVIFVLSDYSSILASKVFFSAFRLDQFNAVTFKLPSGAAAVAINISFLGIAPFLYSAFLDIYEAGVSTKGIFKVSYDENSRAILQMAKLFALKRFDELPSVTKAVRLRSDAIDMSFRLSLLAALHECAHIVLGHLDISREIQRQLNEIGIDSWHYSQALEHQADLFAIQHILHLDEPVPQRWAFELAFACTILFGFGHLVSEYSENSGSSHPEYTFRWTNVRAEFVSSMGSEVVVKRLEGIIEALTTMRQFERM